MGIEDISLENFDRAMKVLTLDLAKYRQDSPRYNQLLGALYYSYQTFRRLSELEADRLHNNTYVAKYADLDLIENLLKRNGYLNRNSPRR